METEFIYWRHDTSVGVRVEELSGGEDKSPRIWKAMALQVFGEQGGDRYREIGHYPSGAPFLMDSEQRISISHTPRFMVIASLPRTPEADLEQFSLRTAMGIDTESACREQALRVSERVMTPDELTLMNDYAVKLTGRRIDFNDAPHVPGDDEARTFAAVLAWTAKEALYKAALEEGMDFRENLKITMFPEVGRYPLDPEAACGGALIKRAGGEVVEMHLFSYYSEGHIVTIALSPKCATFKKR